MAERFPIQLEEASDLVDVFEVVKGVVRSTLKQSRGGLMLGLADLGNHPKGFFGGFFYVGTNVIVMNRVPLMRIKETRPELYKPYVFYVLLHEYLHTLGYLDEGVVRQVSREICGRSLGEGHLATQIAADVRKFFPSLVYPIVGWQPRAENIELISGFDRSSVNYIA